MVSSFDLQTLRRWLALWLLISLFLTSGSMAYAQAKPSAKSSPPVHYSFPTMPVGHARLVGVVRDENGKPVAGIDISLLWLWKQAEPNGATGSGSANVGKGVSTDAAGHFTFSGLPPGQYQCYVIPHPQGDMPGPYVLQTILFTIHKSETAKALPIVVSTGSLVEGRVVDGKTGKPVAGVFVGAGPIPLGRQLAKWESWSMPSEGMTNAEGHYVIRVTSGNVFVGVQPMSTNTAFSRRISPAVQKVDVRPGQTASVPDLSVFLLPMIVFTGPDGHPVANAEVMIMPQHMSQVHYDLQDTTDSSGGVVLQKPFTSGSFSIGHGGLFASGTYQWSAGQPLTIQTDGQIESFQNGMGTVQLTEGSAAIVAGSVVDENGKPIPNAIVHIVELDPKNHYGVGDKLFKTDTSGVFHKALNPNYPAQVYIRADGYNQVAVSGFDQFGGPYGQSLSLVKGKTTDIGTVRLIPADGVVSGRVVDSSGKPMSGVLAYVRGGKTFLSSAMTDSQGRFDIPNVVVGDIIDLHLCRHGEAPDSGEALSQSNEEMVIPDVQAGPVVRQIVWNPHP